MFIEEDTCPELVIRGLPQNPTDDGLAPAVPEGWAGTIVWGPEVAMCSSTLAPMSLRGLRRYVRV